MFATATSLLISDIIRSKAPNVSMAAYVDDTVLLGPAEDVTQAITEVQTEAPWVASNYRKPKHKYGPPPSRALLTMSLFSALFKEGLKTNKASYFWAK